MKTNKEVLKIALKHLGQGGSTFRKFCGLPSNAAWCNAFVDYVANEGGVKSLYFNGKKETYCPHSIKWCESNLALVPPYLAMAMDIIYFDWEKNGVPNHIGFVREKKDTSTIYTLEGNTDGGKVAKKTRSVKYVQGIYRPHYKGTVKLCHLETETGDFGYVSIANLQRALGLTPTTILDKETVKALQRKAGATPDGAWGKNTSKAVQKMIGVTADGEFGKKSVIALKKWINRINGGIKNPSTSVPVSATPKADKIVETAKALAWAYGTAQKKWKYATGAPKTVMKTAMTKYGYDTKVKRSDCGYCINTVVRTALGGKFKALAGVKEKFPSNDGFEIVFSGKAIPANVLKPGDIIRYKKTKGSQHVLMYLGNNRIAEGGRKVRFFVIRKDEKKYNASNVRKSTIQVLRIKE